MNNFTFYKNTDIEQRKTISRRILEKYQNKRLPVICEPDQKTNLDIDKSNLKIKYLVPGDMTVGKFVWELRKNIKLSPEQAIFLFAIKDNKEKLVHIPMTMFELYDGCHNNDGFLYIKYTGENTFGQN